MIITITKPLSSWRNISECSLEIKREMDFVPSKDCLMCFYVEGADSEDTIKHISYDVFTDKVYIELDSTHCEDEEYLKEMIDLYVKLGFKLD
jgi:hypothetical protein